MTVLILTGAYRGRFFGKHLRFFSRFGLQDVQTPPSPLVGEGLRADRTFEQRYVFQHCNAQSAIPSASTRCIGRGGFQTCPLRRSDAARNVYRTYFLSALEWEKGGGGMLTGVDFLASPCVPSPVSAIRTPRLPLLPVWEKGAGGMRGNGARECRTSLISPKNSTLERWGDERQKRTGMQKIAHSTFCQLPAGSTVAQATG